MCEYCTGKRIITSNNFCGSANMRVYGKGMLDLYGDKRLFDIFKKYYRPRFDINYCPMCGAKLND